MSAREERIKDIENMIEKECNLVRRNLKTYSEALDYARGFVDAMQLTRIISITEIIDLREKAGKEIARAAGIGAQQMLYGEEFETVVNED